MRPLKLSLPSQQLSKPMCLDFWELTLCRIAKNENRGSTISRWYPLLIARKLLEQKALLQMATLDLQKPSRILTTPKSLLRQSRDRQLFMQQEAASMHPRQARLAL